MMDQAGDVISDNAAADTAPKDSDNTKTKADDSKDRTYSVKVASGNTVITITQDEVSMLERITEAEASGEDAVGKILIVNVILNRIVCDEFPNTVKGVIFQHDDGEYQFSPVESGRYWDVKVSKETKKAVLRALEGEDYSKGALYFIARKHTKTQAAKWFDKNLDWLFKHGGHEFYK
jgi:N-acetylmuramoyl-L-alanine amidase